MIPSPREVSQYLLKTYPTFNWDDFSRFEVRPYGVPSQPPLGTCTPIGFGKIYSWQAHPLKLQFLFNTEEEKVTFQLWYWTLHLGKDRWSWLVIEGGPQEAWKDLVEKSFQRVYDETLTSVDSLLGIWTKCRDSLNY